MSTRQHRISDAQQIRQQLGRFVGKKINIVLADGTAAIGVLRTTNDREIEVMNMAQKRQQFPWSSISEVYVDSLI